MKKNYLSLLFVVPVLASCSWKIPETVSVKTEASYNFNLGEISKDVSEFISASKISEMVNEQIKDSGKNVNVYEYNPGNADKTLQVLADLSLKEIPIDMSKYLKDMDFSEKIKGQSIAPQDIPVPDLTSLKQEKDITIPDVAEKILDSVKFDVPKVLMLYPPAGDSITIDDTHMKPIKIDVNSTSGDVDSLKFKQGVFEIECEPAEIITDNADIKLNVSLWNGDIDGTDAVKVSESGLVTISNSGKTYIEIPLTNVELSKTVGLKFGGSIAATTGAGGLHGYNMSVQFSDDTKLAKVTNVTMDLGEDGKISIDQTIDAPSNDVFVECIVGSGELLLSAPMLKGWTGISFISDIDMTGGVEASTSNPGDFIDVPGSGYIFNKKMNLNGKAYKKQDIHVTGTLYVSLDHATIEFFEDTDNKIKFNSECKISNIEEATVDLKSILYDSVTGKSKLIYDISEDLPEELIKYVSSIELKESGIKAEYTNSLPKDSINPDVNTIKMKAYSSFFGIGSASSMVSKDIKSFGNTTDKGKLDYITENKTITPHEGDKVDFHVEMQLPGRDSFPLSSEYDYYAKLHNIELGKTYQISMDITPVFEWKQISIKTKEIPDIKDKLSDNIDTGLNFNSIFDSMSEKVGKDFVEHINIKEIPVYIYCMIPDMSALDKLGISGTLNAQMKNKDTGTVLKTLTILDDKPIAIKKTIPELKFNDKKAVISKLSQTEASCYADFAELFNTHEDGSVFIDYSLALSQDGSDELTITREEYDNYVKDGSKSIDIKIMARAILPLKLSVLPEAGKDYVSLNLNTLLDIEDGKDLMNRSEKTDTEDFKKYIDAIDSMSIIYTSTKNMFKYDESGKSANVMFISNTAGKMKDFDLDLDYDVLTLTSSDVITVFETYPFTPTIEVRLPAGDLSILNDEGLSVSVKMSVVTDGTICLTGDK